jgi:CRISPR-associated endonuclease/helicase Cas3
MEKRAMTEYRDFAEMFIEATKIREGPYPYQVRWAEVREPPSMVSVPTGLGKTAGAILSWLWRRRYASEETRQETPRRLVYCLPMRVLVEQTHDCAVKWLRNLDILGGGLDAEESYDPWLGDDDPDKIRVHLLMGGEVDRDWDMYPERDAILIGTQDMLLSRALNRGYALSRFRWPVQYALLNNDCLWVMDEVQLMGSGLATTTQLQAFRRKLGVLGNVKSIWMSATMRPEWLETVDFERDKDAGEEISVTKDSVDYEQNRQVRDRFDAIKKLEKAPFESGKDYKNEAAYLVDTAHQAGELTLVVVNNVKRAQLLYEAVKKRKPKADLVLIHSRFRSVDRAVQLERLLANRTAEGTIAISTQVVEAGVDVSATTLVTDLAPWAALVQRFGRCNRKGELNDKDGGRVVWIAPENLDNDQKLKAEPYTGNELQAAAQKLAKLSDVGPRSLPLFEEALPSGHVVRRKDIVELFDTTPDLAGADIDVSRFIREADEHHVQVFWREIPKETRSPDEPGPAREELCSVPVADIEKEVKSAKRTAWRWDHLEKIWTRPDAIYPGLVLMLCAEQGGYNPETGWTGKDSRTEPVGIPGEQSDSNDDDRLTQFDTWQTIAEHTDRVVAKLDSLIDRCCIPNEEVISALRNAARWHDAGKAHEVFQKALGEYSETPSKSNGKVLWAKSQNKTSGYERLGFRHELASALAMLLNGHDDLSAYLVAAHHGKVRLSIRSLPHEKRPDDDPERRFARGIWDGDRLEEVDLGGGVVMPATIINLSYMEMGEDETLGPSWLARTLALRDDPNLGPFRLAFLETLLRIADWTASATSEVRP